MGRRWGQGHLGMAFLFGTARFFFFYLGPSLMGSHGVVPGREAL